jgi:predicted site-specific integrase-resolvase
VKIYGPSVDLEYARVSTSKQDLDRQIDALTAVGIPAERIYLDKKSGATVDRPGLRALLGTERANQQHLVPVVPARPVEEALGPPPDGSNRTF